MQLARANLIEGNFREVTGGDTNASLTADMAQLSPKLKGANSYLLVFPYNNHLYIRTGLTAYWNGVQPAFRDAAMSGAQASNIMRKLGVDTTLDANTVMYEDKKAFPQGVDTSTGSGNELFIAASVANWGYSPTCMTNTSPPRIIMTGQCNMIFPV